MPKMDAAAKAQLNKEVVKPAFFAFLDIAGEPLRATTIGYNYTFGAVGDPDLNGQTFDALNPTFVNIGEVKNQEGGSDTLTCSLSGLILPDNELMNILANPANWRGRRCRLWLQVRDENGTAQGGIVPYYTGYMVALDIMPSPQGQVIQLKIENYLALLTRASNRNYLSQREYDPTDHSAQATVGTGNNASGPGSGVIGGGGGVRDSNPKARRYLQDLLGS